MFWSAGCSLLRAEGLFCSVDFLYAGLGIGKNVVFDPTFFFSAVNIFYILVIKPPDLDWYLFSLKCWIRIRFKWIRIRNTDILGMCAKIIIHPNNWRMRRRRMRSRCRRGAPPGNGNRGRSKKSRGNTWQISWWGGHTSCVHPVREIKVSVEEFSGHIVFLKCQFSHWAPTEFCIVFWTCIYTPAFDIYVLTVNRCTMVQVPSYIDALAQSEVILTDNSSTGIERDKKFLVNLMIFRHKTATHAENSVIHYVVDFDSERL